MALSDSARDLLRKLVNEYREAGNPRIFDAAWTPSSEEERKDFEALQDAGYVEPHRTANKWQLTPEALEADS